MVITWALGCLRDELSCVLDFVAFIPMVEVPVLGCGTAVILRELVAAAGLHLRIVDQRLDMRACLPYQPVIISELDHVMLAGTTTVLLVMLLDKQGVSTSLHELFLIWAIMHVQKLLLFVVLVPLGEV